MTFDHRLNPRSADSLTCRPLGDHRLVDLASISHILLAVADLTNAIMAAENKNAG